MALHTARKLIFQQKYPFSLSRYVWLYLLMQFATNLQSCQVKLWRSIQLKKNPQLSLTFALYQTCKTSILTCSEDFAMFQGIKRCVYTISSCLLDQVSSKVLVYTFFSGLIFLWCGWRNWGKVTQWDHLLYGWTCRRWHIRELLKEILYGPSRQSQISWLHIFK